MTAHADILDRREPLTKPFSVSLMVHLLAVGGLLASVLIKGSPMQMGNKTGGGMGSVAVSPVASIPLPNPGGPQNPVANDTPSQVPAPPPVKPKPAPKVKLPTPEAIVLPGPKSKTKPSDASSQSNKFRDKQTFQDSQLYTSGGQRLSTPMMNIQGSGGVGLGDSSPFGTEYGGYATIIRDNIARVWNTSAIDARIQQAKPVVVTFRIMKDGSVSKVDVSESSSINPLDQSAKRAVYDAKLPPLPLGFPRDYADVQLRFELRR